MPHFLAATSIHKIQLYMKTALITMLIIFLKVVLMILNFFEGQLTTIVFSRENSKSCRENRL